MQKKLFAKIRGDIRPYSLLLIPKERLQNKDAPSVKIRIPKEK